MKHQKKKLLKASKDTIMALNDAISTFTGDDKIVTAERIEAWKSIIANSQQTVVLAEQDSGKSIGIAPYEDDFGRWSEAATKSGMSVTDWVRSMLDKSDESPKDLPKEKRRSTFIVRVKQSQYESYVKKANGKSMNKWVIDTLNQSVLK